MRLTGMNSTMIYCELGKPILWEKQY